MPWLVNHPIGTEEWFGWSYFFGDNYKVDTENSWSFFQVHEGTSGEAPLISLWSMRQEGPGSGMAGEIHVVNSTNETSTYSPTGIISMPGTKIDIVIHVVWGDADNGWLQVWMNSKKVYDIREATVRKSNPVGGNAKFGIYKWPWREKQGVEASLQQGINSLETFMGPLRIVTRYLDDPQYGEKSFHLVTPN